MSAERIREGEAAPRWRLALLYPLLFAAHPILALAAANPGQFQVEGLITTVLGALAVSAVLYALLALLLRRWKELAALLTFVALFWFFYLIPLSRVPAQMGIPRPFVMTAAAVLVATLALLAWIVVKKPRLAGVTRFLATTGVILVAWSAIGVWRNERAAKRMVESSELVRALEQPVPVRPDSGIDRSAKRDVYIVVLDELANSQVLQERFGFDNRVFDDSLRQLGFVVPSGLHSNYAQTILSLPSFLNFAHLTSLQTELGFTETDYAVPRHLIEQNRTARFLRERGYRFIFFPSAWWRLTLENPHADEQYDAQPGFNLYRELRRTEFRRTLLESTLAEKVQVMQERDLADHLLHTFDELERVAARPEPTLVIAHIMSPHWPFVVDSSCALAAKNRKLPAPAGLKQGDMKYLDQLRCVRTRTLRLVRALQASSPRPVIVLQGDHGTRSLNQANSPALPNAEALRERFGAFGAYYLPDGGAEALGEPKTIVNVLGTVMSYYFGADVKTEPDAMFYSSVDRPFKFFPFDAKLISSAP